MQEKINKKIRQKNEKENWEREREREGDILFCMEKICKEWERVVNL